MRDMMYLSMSYDHRIVDGADAARFLSLVKARLEEGDFGVRAGRLLERIRYVCWPVRPGSSVRPCGSGWRRRATRWSGWSGASRARPPSSAGIPTRATIDEPCSTTWTPW